MQYVSMIFLKIIFHFFTLSKFTDLFPKQKKVLFACVKSFLYSYIKIHCFDILTFFLYLAGSEK